MSKKSVLVVDDSDALRQLIVTWMRSFGFEVSDAPNGADALTKCEEKMPDGILLDWNMPQLTGLEFVKHLRALPNGHTPKVIFCTSRFIDKEIETALAAGADEYIIKPFDQDILVSKLRLTHLL